LSVAAGKLHRLAETRTGQGGINIMANLRFLTGGDVAPVRKSGAGMLGEIASRFRQADVSFLNLEHALSEQGEVLRGKAYFHRGIPAHIPPP
jgi:hypothetical protein